MRNKYPGHCFICGKHVSADRGHFQRMNGRWKIRCKTSIGKGNEPDRRLGEAADPARRYAAIADSQD